MELGNHIAKNSPQWWGCKRVELDGESLQWEMNLNRPYDPLKAYQDGPHREFIEAGTDAALRVFVRRWGPLRRLGKQTSGIDSVRWYRQQRDQFSAIAGLIEAIGEASKRRKALLAVLTAFDLCIDEPRLLFYAEPHFRGIPADREAWCQDASEDEVNDTCIRLANSLPFSWIPTFSVQKRGRAEIVTASLLMNSLFEGLWWMLWQDVFLGRPIRFCDECGRLIDCETKHKRRFCSNPVSRCAQRVADREYKKRKRKRQKSRNPRTAKANQHEQNDRGQS